MKKNLVAAIGVLGVLASPVSFAGGKVVEVPLEGVFAPPVGYDDNDNIELVVHGMLPNTCYHLEKTTVEQVPNQNVFHVRQNVIKDDQGICLDESSLPAHMAMLVPFTTQVSVGKLVGETDYEFEYSVIGGKAATRKLHVSSAKDPTVDSLPYAAVSNSTTADVINGTDTIQTVLTGVLNSSCTEIDSIDVKKVDDVFVVLPTIKVKKGVICTQVMVPFQKMIDLGNVPPGHYLVHVRSMNGKSVNNVVEVMK